MQESEWPQFGKLIPAKPLSREEEVFVKAFADELNYATAIVAANPDESYSVQSLAGRIQKAYLRLNAGKRIALGESAQDLDRRRILQGGRYSYWQTCNPFE